MRTQLVLIQFRTLIMNLAGVSAQEAQALFEWHTVKPRKQVRGLLFFFRRLDGLIFEIGFFSRPASFQGYFRKVFRRDYFQIGYVPECLAQIINCCQDEERNSDSSKSKSYCPRKNGSGRKMVLVGGIKLPCRFYLFGSGEHKDKIRDAITATFARL